MNAASLKFKHSACLSTRIMQNDHKFLVNGNINYEVSKKNGSSGIYSQYPPKLLFSLTCFNEIYFQLSLLILISKDRSLKISKDDC